jgi:CHAT domain-containing protein
MLQSLKGLAHLMNHGDRVLRGAGSILAFVVLCGPVPGGSPLWGQTVLPVAEHACSSKLAEGSEACLVVLSPGQTRSLSIEVPRSEVKTLTAEQTDGLVELRLAAVSAAGKPPQTSDPYANFAGVHSRIHVLLASSQQVVITNPSKDKPAIAILAVTAPQSADANLEIEQAAQQDFAHAELLRIQDAPDGAETLKTYDRAIANWRAAGDRLGLGRALIWKADFVLHSQGNAPEAVPLLQQASELLPLLDPVEAANYWYISAGANAVQGKYDLSKQAYSTSLQLYEACGDLANQAKILDNLARTEFMEGSSETALIHEKRAAALAGTAGDVRRQAFVQEELGGIYSTLGDFESSYRAYGQALAQLKLLPPNPRMEGATWTDLSDFYSTLGDLGREKDSLDQAAAIWKKTEYPIGVVDTLNNYADLYLAEGQLHRARESFERGLEISEKIHYERGSIALLSGLGDIYLHQADAAHAEEILKRALARAEKAGQADSKTQILCQLGDVSLLKRDLGQAKQYYEQCRKASVAYQDTYNQIRAQGGLAHAAFDSNELDDAQTFCEEALAGIEAARGHLRNQDLQTSFFASQHAYYDLAIRVLERLDRIYPNEGYQWQAFLTAERARARTLLDEVTAANSEIRVTSSQALLAQYEDIQRRLRQLEADPGQRSEPESTRTAALQASIARLTASEHQLHQEVLATTQEQQSLLPQLTLEALQRALPDSHAALVEYWTGEQASYAWSITRSGIRGFRLPRAGQLERQCEDFRKALLAAASPEPSLSAEQRAAAQPQMESKWKALGSQLATALFPAGMVSASTATVLVVADGPIESTPLAALRETASNDHPFLRSVTFLSEPSATIFSFLEAQPTTPRAMRLAIFSPEQTSSAEQRRNATQTPIHGAMFQQLAALPFAADEVAMLRTLFGPGATQSFSADSLSPETLGGLDWSKFSIGHFAMHAVLNERYADLTGLSPGGADSPGSSAHLLWYGDICHLHARLDLVVLSACNTALGERIPGEGLRGLMQAFLAAGSQRVLGTLWEVDDQATGEWMRYFYQSLQKTRSPQEALRAAQNKMAADPQWSSPYYWSGFVLAGDWRPLP